MKKSTIDRRKLALMLTCVCSLYISKVAWAGEALPEFYLDQTIVTATRTKLDTKKVPQAVEVISAQDIKELGAYNVNDALRLATNINLGTIGMAGNMVQIRGMDTRHALILIDGKRMAGEDSATTTNVYELSRIDLNTVDKIEIVRGPASAMYGSDALGGVINIITKKSEKASTAIGMGASNMEQDMHFRFNSGRQGKFKLIVGGRISEVREQHSALNQSTNMYGPRRHLDLSLDYALGKDRGLTLDLNFMREQFAEIYDNVPSVSLNQREWFDNNRAAYSLTYYGKDKVNDYQLRTYYNILKKESRKVNYTAGYNGWADFDHMRYDNFVVEGKNSAKLSDKHTLTYGGEYRDIGARSTRIGAGGDNISLDNFNGLSKPISEKRLKTYGAYVQDEWQVNAKLFVLSSLRYDYHSSFGSNIAPKLGLSYKVHDGLRIKANYGKGYRAPSIFQLYSEMKRYMGSMQVEIYGNPDLKPEQSNSFDVALEMEKGKASGKLAYFSNDIKDLIDSKTIATIITPGSPMILKSQYVNVNKAQINGIEAEFAYKFNDKLTLKAIYNYLDAKNKVTNTRLANRAQNQFSLRLNYNDNKAYPLNITLWNELNLNYRYEWLSGRNTYSKNYSYNTWNIAVNKQLDKNKNLYLGVDNIFNKQYRATTAEPFEINGRIWRVGLNMNF